VLALLVAIAPMACAPATAPVDGELRLSLIVGLRRDDAGLAADVLRRSTPSDPLYRQWLTPAEIAERYGAPAADAEAALATLRAAGFTGALDPTGGLLVGEMRAADAAAFFGRAIVRVAYGKAGELAMPAERPAIPAALGEVATEVVGLVHGLDRDTTTSVPAPAEPLPSDPPCPPVQGLGPLYAQHYGALPLWEAGATGQGVRIAMLQVAPTSQQALRAFAACRPRVRVAPVTVTAVDGSSPEAFSERAAESTLDIIAASLMAPGLAGIDIYQVNGFAPVAIGLAAILAQAETPAGLPAIVSLSLGFCEPEVTDAEIAVGERVLMGLAAMGTSVLASSGDFGSSACAPSDLAESVQYPASSPWVVGVGGTSFVISGGEITDEVAWSQDGYGGGGGRTSRIPRPSWQAGIPIEGGRIVPDVAFLADPETIGPIPLCDTSGACAWSVNAGTSATAPGVAGGIALILSSAAGGDPGFRLGALAPALYGMARNLAQEAAGTVGYTDIVSGTNDVHEIGCCDAAPGFDAVTGWGVLKFSEVAQRLGAFLARDRPS